MMMQFAWVSWKPPKLSPEAELQLARVMNAVGRPAFVKQFWGFRPRGLPPSDKLFFDTHAAGLVYLGLIFAGFLFIDLKAPASGNSSGTGILVLLVAAGWVGAILFYGSMIVAAGRYAAWLGTIESKYHLPSDVTPAASRVTSDDNPFYGVVAGEIEKRQIDNALWTRAVANSNGDDKLAKSLYIRYRAKALLDADTQQTRRRHEAQVLERERQKKQECQIREAAAAEETEESQWGCLVGLSALCLFIIVIEIASNQGASYPAPASYVAPPAVQSTPSVAERRAANQQHLTELQSEYAALAARRAVLHANDPIGLATFNRDAADYTSRCNFAVAEKARLEKEASESTASTPSAVVPQTGSGYH